MLKRACICIVTLSFLVVMGLPIAQARVERRIKVQVPFDFYMRDRVLAAGEYEVQEIAAEGASILVRSADGSEQLIALTRDADPKSQRAANARLVFHRYGDQYFLAAVWMDASQGHTLSASSRERSLRRELAQGSQQVAPEMVTVNAEIAVH
jgi:hypothetical protein